MQLKLGMKTLISQFFMFYCDFKFILNRSSKCVCSAVTMGKQMHWLGNTRPGTS